MMKANETPLENNFKKMAILMTWSFSRDSRAQRIANSLSKYYSIDIYTINNGIDELDNFENNYSIIDVPCRESRNILDRFYLPFYSKISCLTKYLLKLNTKYDVIYCHDLPALIVGSKLKAKNKAKLVYDVHDLFKETINQGFSSLGHSRFSKLKSLLLINLFKYFIYRKERKYIKQADLTYSVNESISDYINKLYSVKCLTIQNFPELKSNLFDKKLRKTFKLSENSKIVLYHGNLGDGRHIENIVESAYHFSEGINLILIGNGYLLDKLIKLGNPSNTFFLDYVPYNELFDFIAEADLGLVLLEHINYSKKHASANKFFECMACGIPVIASKSPELIKVFNKSDVGFLIDEITPITIAHLVNQVIFNSEDLRIKGNNGRNLCETEMNWDNEKDKLISLFKSL